MPAISFSTLREKILSGEKKQTIRPLRSDYWLRFKEGDRLIGYWRMRTAKREKLFDSVLSEDPFKIPMMRFSEELMRVDGFKGLRDALDSWFIPKYGYIPDMEFVVIRWR